MNESSVGQPQDDDLTWLLETLFAYAALINRQYEQEFDLTFTSMLLAFLVSHDPLAALAPALGPDENRAAWERWREGLTVRFTLGERLPPLFTPLQPPWSFSTRAKATGRETSSVQ